MSSFIELGVPESLSRVLTKLDIVTPTPIQQATLPDSIAGRDVLGRGRTGSGKTLAFLLPLVTRLTDGRKARPGRPRALILAPTRELVSQIETALKPLAAAAGLTSCTVFGGVGQGPQVSALKRGVDVVVACPGRLNDLIKQGHCSLAGIEITILDEADHMADLGFLPVVRRLLAETPAGGQRMFFSATLDKAVDALVRQFLSTPAVHEADSAQSPVSTMSHHLLQVDRDNRLAILTDLTSAPGRTVVFARTKHGAKALARQLNRSGVPAVELHGNLSQGARTRALEDFSSGRASALVATDIAARGIHVDDVSLVIHADPPADHKAYLHRSGRTARAGNIGTVVTLMATDQVSEVNKLARAAGIKPTTTRVSSADHPILAELAPGDRVLQAPIDTARPAESTPARSGSGSRSGSRSGAGSRTGSGAGAGGGSGRRRGGRSSGGASSHQASGQSSATPSTGGRRRGRPSSDQRQVIHSSHSASSFSSGRR